MRKQRAPPLHLSPTRLRDVLRASESGAPVRLPQRLSLLELALKRLGSGLSTRERTVVEKLVTRQRPPLLTPGRKQLLDRLTVEIRRVRAQYLEAGQTLPLTFQPRGPQDPQQGSTWLLALLNADKTEDTGARFANVDPDAFVPALFRDEVIQKHSGRSATASLYRQVHALHGALRPEETASETIPAVFAEWPEAKNLLPVSGAFKRQRFVREHAKDPSLSVDTLVQLLGEDSALMRRAVCDALVARGAAGLSALREVMAGPSSFGVHEPTRVIMRLGDSRDPAVDAWLRDYYPTLGETTAPLRAADDMRIVTLLALSKRGDPAALQWLQQAQPIEEGVLHYVPHMLAELGSPEAMDWLRRLAADERFPHPRALAGALRLHPDAFREELQALKNHPDIGVRWAAGGG